MDSVIANVGRQIRTLREARGVTLGALADDTGYSASYLGQVESGAAIPGLSVLATLAAALDTDATAFFPREDGSPVHVVRAGDPHKLRVAPNASEEYVILSERDPDASFSALTHRIFPAMEVTRIRHVGERFALVLDGSVTLTISGEAFDLRAGDTIHYASHPEHNLRVTSNGPAEILWFVSPAII